MLGMKIGPRTLVSGNSIHFPSPDTHSAITVYGNNVTLRDNRITIGGGLVLNAGGVVGLINENTY